MSVIKLLPEHLINQIAAGEVVDRPASVVKELVENSLDAGADKIVIEIEEGGKKLIRISDNGCGMSPEDCELSLKKHATSKISSEEDLWNINTMGFRGEAVASIASISQFTIRSKRESDLIAHQLKTEGGEVLESGSVSGPNGTQIEVRNLFFNTPARQKYLKQDSTELAHITSMLSAIALSQPNVALKLYHNGKNVFDYPKVTDLLARIHDIFGSETASNMLPIFYGGQDFQFEGFIGKPSLSRSTSKYQYFFVNQRPIQHYLFANTIKSAFHSMLMEDKKPFFLINIKVAPEQVDVNVHPRKTEVRFQNEQIILKALYSATRSTLEKNVLMPRNAISAETSSYSYASSSLEKPLPRFTEPSQRATVGEAMTFSSSLLNNRRGDIPEFKTPNLQQVSMIETEDDLTSTVPQALAQFANSYIIATQNNQLILIDQHAAHERVRYEELMDQFHNQEKSTQPLLVAAQIRLTSEEIDLLNQNREIMEGLGFEIDDFGANSVMVQAVPACLAQEDLESVIKGLVDDLGQHKNASNLQGKTETVLTYMSCRSAIKFGKVLSLAEMQTLLNQMENLKYPYTCPHGRPTMIELNLQDLGRMFGRK